MTEIIQADVAELQRFLTLTERAGVKKCLQDAIRALESKLPPPPAAAVPMETTATTATTSAAAPAAASAAAAPAAASNTVYSQPSGYSFAQDGKDVDVYVTLPGVGALAADAVRCDFTKNEFDLKVHQLNGQNYRLRLRVHGDIVPSSCSFRPRKDKVRIQLKKKENNHWSTLEYKEDRFKKTDTDTKDDPNASIMKLMQNMYEDGDDEMKRTIAKAWYEGQNKKKDDPAAPMDL